MSEFDDLCDEYLRPAQQESFGREVGYARGALNVTVTAVRGTYRLAGLTDLGDQEGQFHDELIAKADLVLSGSAATPADGDTITVTEADGDHTYTVAAAQKDGAVCEEFSGGTLWRVHVRH